MNAVEAMKRIEELENRKIASLSEEDRSQIVIQDVIYLGKINNVDMYRLSEQDKRDNYSSVIYKYCDENAKLKGVKNQRPDGELEWIPNDSEEWDKLKDEIEKNEALIEEEIEQILSGLGMSKEEIENITEVDLEQKLKEKNENEEEQDEVEEELEQDDEKREDKKEQKQDIEQTSEFKNSLQEIDTSKRIDQKGTTLAKALGLEYNKILVVHSNKVNNVRDENGKRLRNSTKQLALLGVTKRDGRQVVEKIPESKLQYYRGNNNNSVRFDDNDEVEKNSGTTERFVNPSTNRGIAIERSEMETKVYYQGGIDRDDNTAVMGRVEDSHTGWINTETKEIFNANHGIYHQDKINAEMDRHHEDDGEEIHRDNADGDLDTVSDHIHEIDEESEIVYKGELMSVEDVAKMPEFKISVKHFVELYNKNAKDFDGKDDIDMDELYEEIEEDVNEELQTPPNR